MFGAISLALLLLGAPDDGTSKKLLRIAYASQYEWKEDRIANATFDFEWTEAGEDRKKVKWTLKARGSVVVVDGEIKRVHIPGTGRIYRDLVRTDLRWVLRRFARKPFEERFKDAKFELPEKMADGNTRIAVNGQRFLVADNRIVGMEIDVGTAKKPSDVRLELTTGDMGGGYGILGERISHSFGGIKTEREQVLSLATDDGVPVPKSMRFTRRDRKGTVVRTIEFSRPRLNSEHPVVIDVSARDRVKAAWERRYTWPAGLRFEGTWDRQLDSATTKGRWTRDAKGEFQLLRGDFELTMNEDVRVQKNRRPRILKSSTADLLACFRRVMPIPFEDAFPGCGFEPDAADGDSIVRIIGHPRILALRVEDGVITGHRTDEFGGVEWWSYKLKKLPDDRMRLDRMTRRIGRKKRTVKFAYSTKKGVAVLKSVERVVTANASGSGEPDDVGIIKYVLKRLFVQVKE